MARWIGIAAVSMLVACGSRTPRVIYPPLAPGVAESVHRDFRHCRGRDLRGIDLGGGRWELHGCGAEGLVYVCPTGGYQRGEVCYPDQQAGYVTGATAGGSPQYVVVTGGAAGTQTIQATPVPETVPPPPGAATATAPATTGATVTAQAPTLAQIEAAIGQWLDSSRTTILGCTHTQAALLEVAWTADGTTTVALGGELHGTPGEQCVVTALANVRLNVAGQAGSTRHVVQ